MGVPTVRPRTVRRRIVSGAAFRHRSHTLSFAMTPDALPRNLTLPPLPAGTFRFAAAHLDHAHIYEQCRGLIAAGAEIGWVYDPEPARVAAFRSQFPQARAARSLAEILDDPAIRLVTAAAVPSERAALGCRVLRAGRDYLTDKPGFTTLEQLAAARRAVAETRGIFSVFYGDRLGVESTVHAEHLIRAGVLGRVLQVVGLGPHRLNAARRPPWFFRHEQYGGILCDLGTHQCDKFLAFTGSTDAEVAFSAVGNLHHPEYPELEDYGEATLIGSSGATNHHRVDWFTPDGQSTWGDGRTFVLGTSGTIELRGFCDPGRGPEADLLILVDGKGEHLIPCGGRVGVPFFGRFLRDCLERTERAMTQAHCFVASEVCLRAQAAARRLSAPR
jgi:predicted dehydrogenase